MERIRVPLNPAPMVGFIVYFRQVESAEFSSPAHLDEFIHTWLDMHAPLPLREAIDTFLAAGFLQPQIIEREEMPEPPEDYLRAYNPGEIEECRFRDATHIALVGTQDLILMPRVGYWAAVAVSRALATHFVGGVILDPEFPRLLPREKHLEDLPHNGMISITEHILVTVTPHEPARGQCTMFTRGMMRFGLPDLEMQEVPANLVKSLLLVLNGVAQHLMERSTFFAEEYEEKGDDLEQMRHLEIPEEILLTREDMRLAYPTRTEKADILEEKADILEEKTDMLADNLESTEGGQAVLRISLHLSPDSPPVLHLLPPRVILSSETPRAVWYNQVLSDLFGPASVRDIPTLLKTAQTNDPAVLQAQQQALKTLSQVKMRFQKGFRSGEVLYIKHGFILESGNHEYMWINVTDWTDAGEIRGQLANEPRSRLDLHVGQEVSIIESNVFDWLITYLDGRSEGGHTTNALHETFDSQEETQD